MIYYFFGLPGSGKTSHLVASGISYNDKITNPRGLFHRCKYKRVLSNVKFSVPADDIEVYYFDNDDFGKYDMSNSLILFDEASFKFDCRDFAKLPRVARDFLMLHRHYKCDIFFYNQLYHGIDSKIRELTQGTYQLQKNILTGKTTVRKINYDIYFPRKPRTRDLQKIEVNNGEPKETYYRAGLIEQFFSNLLTFPKITLKKYYSYFDSFEAPALDVKEFERMKKYND